MNRLSALDLSWGYCRRQSEQTGKQPGTLERAEGAQEQQPPTPFNTTTRSRSGVTMHDTRTHVHMLPSADHFTDVMTFHAWAVPTGHWTVGQQLYYYLCLARPMWPIKEYAIGTTSRSSSPIWSGEMSTRLCARTLRIYTHLHSPPAASLHIQMRKASQAKHVIRRMNRFICMLRLPCHVHHHHRRTPYDHIERYS